MSDDRINEWLGQTFYPSSPESGRRVMRSDVGTGSEFAYRGGQWNPIINRHPAAWINITANIGGYGAGSAPTMTYGAPSFGTNNTNFFAWSGWPRYGITCYKGGNYLVTYAVGMTHGAVAAGCWNQIYVDGNPVAQSTTTIPWNNGGGNRHVASAFHYIYLNANAVVAHHTYTSYTATILAWHTNIYIHYIGT